MGRAEEGGPDTDFLKASWGSFPAPRVGGPIPLPSAQGPLLHPTPAPRGGSVPGKFGTFFFSKWGKGAREKRRKTDWTDDHGSHSEEGQKGRERAEGSGGWRVAERGRRMQLKVANTKYLAGANSRVPGSRSDSLRSDWPVGRWVGGSSITPPPPAPRLVSPLDKL